MDALEKTVEYMEGAPAAEEARAKVVEVDNERSLAQLEQMMRGVQ